MSRLALLASLGFGLLFVAWPLVAMAWSTVSGPDGISLAAWAEVLRNDTDRAQLSASLVLGCVATALAVVLGGGHAWLTWRTDLPGARWLGPLGVLPLAMPPILVAMGFADIAPVDGFAACAGLLGLSYAPFVAVLFARGLRAVDGRGYEAALLARGRPAAERMLLRSALPELLAGALLAFVFVVSEHGVPEFLTVKGKTWHTYAEGVFARWTRRAVGTDHAAAASPVVAALPLLAIIGVALWAALRLRARSGDRAPVALPLRPLGAWRLPALLLPAVYLGAGVVLPVVVMARWAAGSTVVDAPLSLATARASFRSALHEAGGDLAYTLAVAACTAAVVVLVALPLARLAARRFGAVEHLSVVPLAVPAVLLGIGFVRVFNDPMWAPAYAAGFDFYDSPAVLVAAYAARFLPFGVLTLAGSTRRVPRSLEESALLSGAPPLRRALRLHLPLALPAMASAACLVYVLALRELDVAVVLPSGNGTVVRRLSNVVHFGGEDLGGALALLLLAAAVLVPALVVLLSGRRLRSLS